MAPKRRDNKGRILQMGEWQEPNGRYRYTFCSNMARQGINPKTLQYIMGHSDIAVTMNVYTHLGLDDAERNLSG